MASAGDARRLIPADLWPSIPPRYPHTDVTSTVFQCKINLAREQIGLCTKGKLLVNRHYTLLLAHLLVFPEEIHHARDIPPPYPWPFVIRLDAEGTPYLDRQADITKRQWPLAKRIEKELQRQSKQAGRLPNRSLPKTAKTPDVSLECHEMSAKRRSVAEVVDRVMRLHPNKSWTFIRTHPLFEDAQVRAGTAINTDAGMSMLMSEFYGPGWRKPRGRGLRVARDLSTIALIQFFMRPSRAKDGGTPIFC